MYTLTTRLHRIRLHFAGVPQLSDRIWTADHRRFKEKALADVSPHMFGNARSAGEYDHQARCSTRDGES
jgi:hypothetical protein